MHIRDGWLLVPYDGPELATIYLSAGIREPGDWEPAFLDYDDEGNRVAMIRQPDLPGTVIRVWIRVDGVVTMVGRLS